MQKEDSGSKGGGTPDAIGLTPPETCTAFLGMRRIASGAVQDVAVAAKRAMEVEPSSALLVFEDATSHRMELDLRGTESDVQERLKANTRTADTAPEPEEQKQPRPGRPKLGVVAREVTLLPRHWDWLNGQPGGASVALRKLVEEARRVAASKDRIRQSQEATYRFLSAIGGDLPQFEEVTRALFAGDGERFDVLMADWPIDIWVYARELAADALPRGTE